MFLVECQEFHRCGLKVSMRIVMRLFVYFTVTYYRGADEVTGDVGKIMLELGFQDLCLAATRLRQLIKVLPSSSNWSLLFIKFPLCGILHSPPGVDELVGMHDSSWLRCI